MPDEREPYFTADDIRAFRSDLADTLRNLTGLFGDLTRVREMGGKLPAEHAKYMHDTLRLVSTRVCEITVTLAHTSEGWVPGVDQRPAYSEFAGMIQVATSLLAPNVAEVLALDLPQSHDLDERLDDAQTQIERYRRLLLAARIEMPNADQQAARAALLAAEEVQS